MSIRAVFGIGATVGFITASLLGSPILPALVYGLLTGSVFAAIAATPPGRQGIAVVHHRSPSWFVWPSFRSGVAHRRVHGATVVPPRAAVHTSRPAAVHVNTHSQSSGWFPSMPSFGGGASTTTVHRAPNSRPVATTTSVHGGGTRHSATSAVPAHAHNVRTTRTIFR
ncbi:MAG: hypothetical protein AB7V32_00855 [Candidatus Berkiella sp.]